MIEQILKENDLSKKQALIEESLLNEIPHVNPFLYATDSYKVSHIRFETSGVKEIYSNFTPRFAKHLQTLLGQAYDDKYVVFGVQWMLLRLHMMAKVAFFDKPKKEVIEQMKKVHSKYIGNNDFEHFEKLHDLGYLPIHVKTLDEGSVVNVGVPFLTIRNTLPEFEWLPNFLETIISTDLWKQLTVATIGRAYRMVTDKYALETTGNTDLALFQNHDFSCRGQAGFESSAIVGLSFLLSSCGTDNIPALWAAEKFYFSTNDQDLLAGSVPAGEHSVTTSGILTEKERNGEISLDQAELLYAKNILCEKFPTGIVSYVADSYDYWSFVKNILPQLKNEIMSRDGKFVVRGDSGDPVHIIAGYEIQDITNMSYTSIDEALNWSHLWLNPETEVVKYGTQYVKLNTSYCRDGSIEGFNDEYITKEEAEGTIAILYEIFGGEINDLGYKVLDSHIGMIYGDGITIERQHEILSRLKNKKFASTNIVFGVGSYSLNMVSRDHLGMAIKATNTIVDINGQDIDKPIYKSPKTDPSKKSAMGLIAVRKEGDKYIYDDLQSRDGEESGLLTTVYSNGQFEKITNIFEIRNRVWN